jgi:hypothetical protein
MGPITESSRFKPPLGKYSYFGFKVQMAGTEVIFY